MATSGSEVDIDGMESGEMQIGRGGLRPKTDKVEAAMKNVYYKYISLNLIILCSKFMP